MATLESGPQSSPHLFLLSKSYSPSQVVKKIFQDEGELKTHKNRETVTKATIWCPWYEENITQGIATPLENILI